MHIRLSPLSSLCCRGSCASFFFTRALVVSRTQSRPRCKVRIGGEHFHVHANLCKYVDSGRAPDSRYFAKERHFLLDRLHVAVDFLINVLYLTFEVFNTLADGPEHELVVLHEVSLNGKGYLLLGTLQSPVSTQRGKELRVCVACKNIVYDFRARLAGNIAEHT